MKTDDDGLRDRDWTYSWYNSTGIDDGGDEGMPARGACVDPSLCDTEKYAAAVNDAAVCGRSDWRLPTRAELLSLVDHGASTQPLAVDSYFPDLGVVAYWSSSSAGDEAFNVDFIHCRRGRHRLEGRPAGGAGRERRGIAVMFGQFISYSSKPRVLFRAAAGCSRSHSISAGASMLAITSSRPPQLMQRSISIANGRASPLPESIPA
jgi:hypothetical protein